MGLHTPVLVHEMALLGVNSIELLKIFLKNLFEILVQSRAKETALSGSFFRRIVAWF